MGERILIQKNDMKYNLLMVEATLVPDDLCLPQCMYLVFQYFRLASQSFADYPIAILGALCWNGICCVRLEV